MNTIKLLVEGYAKKFDNHKKASSAVVFIETEKYKIIVDPGLDRKKLLNALKKENIKTNEIDFIVITHNHIDHFAIAGIFEKAVILDNKGKYSQNGQIKKQEENILGENIKIIATPGHDPNHCSVLVETKEMGKVLIAGDLFWWREDNEPNKDIESLINLNDLFVKDEIALKESRKKVLNLADYIIPGHGKMFKVEK